MLTHTKGQAALAFIIQNRGWQMSSEISEVELIVDGTPCSRSAHYGHPNVELNSELASVLRRGLRMLIAIRSEEGSAHHYSSHLAGFTRVHDCV